MTLIAISMEGKTESRTLTIIGVMRDFHQLSLRRAIEPMVFIWEERIW